MDMSDQALAVQRSCWNAAIFTRRTNAGISFAGPHPLIGLEAFPFLRLNMDWSKALHGSGRIERSLASFISRKRFRTYPCGFAVVVALRLVPITLRVDGPDAAFRSILPGARQCPGRRPGGRDPLACPSCRPRAGPRCGRTGGLQLSACPRIPAAMVGESAEVVMFSIAQRRLMSHIRASANRGCRLGDRAPLADVAAHSRCRH